MNTANGSPAASQATALQAALQQFAVLQNPYAALFGGAGQHPLLGQLQPQTPSPSGQQQSQTYPPSNLNINVHGGLNPLGSLLGGAQSQAGGIQQLLADAMRLSAPVGNCPDDDDLLVTALYESEQKGWTYRRALDGLHEVCSIG